MATLIPGDEWEPDASWDNHITIQNPSPTLLIASRRRARAPRTISALQRTSMHVLAYVSRYWRVSLTAAQRLQWGTLGDILQFRNADNVASHAMIRWIQIQHALMMFSQPPLATGATIERWLVTNMALVVADADSQLIKIGYDLQGQHLTPHRSVINYHQVPHDAIGTGQQWRYARHIYSRDLDYTPLDLNANYNEDVAEPFFPFEAGDTVNLYVRITHCQNLNPPVSKHTSHLTTEDWTALTIVAT